MDGRTTLKDIAQALSVSIGTVERAIHGKQDISSGTRQLVLDKIKELNYIPNKHARSLSLKSSQDIVVIMPYNSPFWYRMREGIENAAQELAFCGVSVRCVCLNRMDGNLVLSHLKDACSRKVDGIILVPDGVENIVGKIRETIGDHIPLAMLNDDLETIDRQFYVGPDNQLIGRLAGELVGKFSGGQGKCLALSATHMKSGQLSSECRLRLEGFRSVLELDYPGIRLDVATYEQYGDNAYDAMLGFLSASEDLRSIYSVDGFLQEVAMAVKDSGKKGLVLVGHEMSSEVNRHLKEGTASAAICQNPYLQGHLAVKYMSDLLVDRKLPPQEKMFINFTLFTRYNTYGEENYIGSPSPTA
jgi:LacI family transcriptional regulator